MPQHTQTLAPTTGPHVKAKLTAPQPKPRMKLVSAPIISSHWKDCMISDAAPWNWLWEKKANKKKKLIHC